VIAPGQGSTGLRWPLPAVTKDLDAAARSGIVFLTIDYRSNVGAADSTDDPSTASDTEIATIGDMRRTEWSPRAAVRAHQRAEG